MHAGKLGQVINLTVESDSAKHCVDQYMVLFRYCSLRDDTAMSGGLHARFCHTFLVLYTYCALQCKWLLGPFAVINYE